jgi:hypothetical protein
MGTRQRPGYQVTGRWTQIPRQIPSKIACFFIGFLLFSSAQKMAAGGVFQKAFEQTANLRGFENRDGTHDQATVTF